MKKPTFCDSMDEDIDYASFVNVNQKNPCRGNNYRDLYRINRITITMAATIGCNVDYQCHPLRHHLQNHPCKLLIHYH